MKQQIVAIKKVTQNKNRLTVHEAETLASQIKRITQEAEVHFKSGESKLKSCAPLIERMIECKGESGKDGWQLIGYKNFEDWARENLNYKYVYSRTFYKATLALIELKKSTSQDIVEFVKNARVAHLAAVGNAPEGSRAKAVMLAKEIGGSNLSERIIEDAVEKLKPVGIEEDKLKVLTSSLTATSKEWMKVKNAANIATLSAALSYWQKELHSKPREKTIESRIRALSERIEYLNGKKPSSISQQTSERQDIRKELSIDFSSGGLLSIEDSETFSTYIKVVPKDKIWKEVQNIKDERDRLIDNLEEAGGEIIGLTKQVNELKQELEIVKQNQAVVRSEWEVELVDIVTQLNNRTNLVLN